MGPEELEVFSNAKYYTSAWSPGVLRIPFNQ
jgi:hypothetical protein